MTGRIDNMNEKWNVIAVLLAQNRPVFEALGDVHRQEILVILASERRSVGELAVDIGLSRPAVSHHIKILKQAGLLEESRQGVRRYYTPTFSTSRETISLLLQELTGVR